MELRQLITQLNLKPLNDDVNGVSVTGGYSSDLLSDVLANAKNGNIWITNQRHVNVIAVASLLGLSGVIIAGGTAPDENTVKKAREENVPLFISELPAFEIV